MMIKKNLSLFVLVLFLVQGCASLTNGDRGYIAGVVADIGTTAIAFEMGMQEVNPLYDESWESLAVNALVSAALWWGVKAVSKDWDPATRNRTLWVMGSLRLSFAAMNTESILENEK